MNVNVWDVTEPIKALIRSGPWSIATSWPIRTSLSKT